jgi:hypothetical protein
MSIYRARVVFKVNNNRPLHAHVMGLSKRCHSTHLLKAMDISKLRSIITRNTLSLFHRIYKIDSPLITLCNTFIAKYIADGTIIQNTIVGRILNYGLSPVSVAYQGAGAVRGLTQEMDGIAESLQFLPRHENFLKPYSDEHVLTQLLLKAF